jgi:hypothetical protein
MDIEKDISLTFMNEETRQIELHTYNKLSAYMKRHHSQSSYIIIKDCSYIKRYNISNDNTQWDGWRVEAFTITPSYKKIIMVSLRQRFIPPFLETCSDFLFTCEQDLSDLNQSSFLLYKDYENMVFLKDFELIIDSIHSNSKYNILDFRSIIQIKYESLSLQPEVYSYITNVLKIQGFETYILGNIFILKVIKKILVDYVSTGDGNYQSLARYYLGYIRYTEEKIKSLISEERQRIEKCKGGKDSMRLAFEEKFVSRLEKLAVFTDE